MMITKHGVESGPTVRGSSKFANFFRRKKPALETSKSHNSSTIRQLVYEKKYKELDLIPVGAGSFGAVFKVERKTDQIFFAAKRMMKANPKTKDLKLFKKEGLIMQKLCHSNIIKCVEILQTVEEIILILEYGAGGDLNHALIEKKYCFTEQETKIILTQILSAMQYLRERKITHRDLKMEQFILMSPMDITTIKLTDFGLAKKDGEKSRKGEGFFTEYSYEAFLSKAGTKAFAAPEIYAENSRGYDYKVDVWSLGVITYCLLSGYYPYGEHVLRAYDEHHFKNTFPELERKRQRSKLKLLRDWSNFMNFGEYTFDESKGWNGVSNEAKRFLSLMLRHSPEDRADFIQLANDTWLRGKNQRLCTL
eukprot:snap_masked-scaffold_6-processed-gene-20.15-mRNA-1 protein AED:1.00 eAED:1.00 QI:0/-1/0/0/-1/1/1/0/364